MQRAYWRQREKIRWIKEGDARTKFFHAHATLALTSVQGTTWTAHEQKANLIWDSFKAILSLTEAGSMLFNLEELLIRHENLDDLDSNFLKEEIDKVMKDLPNESPGPDGFNNEFIKKCWPFIASDFYDLC